MPNHCKYEIHVRGKRKAALMLCATTPFSTYKNIVKEYGDDDCYIVHFVGDCNVPLDDNCRAVSNVTINTTMMTEDSIRDGFVGKPYWHLPLRQKSELLGLELLIRMRSQDLGFDHLERYRNGYFISIEGMEYNDENKFEFEF